MYPKRLILIAILILALGLTALQAQTLYIKEKSGIQSAYALSNIRKITFSGGNVIVLKTNNSTGVYALSGLSYLNFTDLTTRILKQPIPSSHSKLTTYPNPVIELLNIDLTGVTGEGMISILTLEGKIMQTQNTSGNSLVTLNISHLSQGVYLCRFVNALEIKTVIITKQ